MIDLRHIPGVRRWFGERSSQRLHLLRYHGLWGPGVRLLQNLRFRSKVLLLVVSLMLPLGYLLTQLVWGAWDHLQQTRRAGASLHVYEAVLEQQQALSELSFQIYLTEQDPQQEAGIAAALGKAQAAAKAVQDRLAEEPTVHQQLGDAAHLLNDDLQRLNDAMKDKRAGADGADSPRLAAINGIQDGLDGLRQAVLRVGGGAMHDHDANLAIYTAGLQTVPMVHRQLWRSARQGARVYSDVGRATAAVRLLDMAAVTQYEVENLQRHLDALVTSGMADSAALRRTLDQLSASCMTMRSLAQAALSGQGETALNRSQHLNRDAYMAQAVGAQRAAWQLQGQMIELSRRAQDQRWHEALSQMSATLGISLACLLLMAYLLVCIVKVVGGGLRELVLRVEALAQGDLSEKPEARGSDEVGQALTALAASTQRMSSLFEAVTQGVAAVSFASREVAIGNAGLNGRTGDIRRSIENVGERARASMEAMNRAGSEVDRIANHMRDVRADARRSRKAMTELIRCMQGLQAKSREIGRVVMLVESVAHQTRLLSLNASVEAARAGVAGKGFAVVAQEVRSLAQRSEAAAHKIGEIVKASVDEIEEGSLLSERVGESVRLTDERVSEVSAIMGDIVRLTQAGREESQEVVGITRQVEDSASGNARMVEQLANASAGLREQGDHLKRSMQHFVFG